MTVVRIIAVNDNSLFMNVMIVGDAKIMHFLQHDAKMRLFFGRKV